MPNTGDLTVLAIMASLQTSFINYMYRIWLQVLPCFKNSLTFLHSFQSLLSRLWSGSTICSLTPAPASAPSTASTRPRLQAGRNSQRQGSRRQADHGRSQASECLARLPQVQQEYHVSLPE